MVLEMDPFWGAQVIGKAMNSNGFRAFRDSKKAWFWAHFGAKIHSIPAPFFAPFGGALWASPNPPFGRVFGPAWPAPGPRLENFLQPPAY